MAAYIKFPGVEGESRAADSGDTIDLLIWNDGDGSELDKSSTKLQEACANGTFFEPEDDSFDFAPVEEEMETRESLEAAGLEVVVAAATTEDRPTDDIQVYFIEIKGTYDEPDDGPVIQPDLALTDVSGAEFL